MTTPTHPAPALDCDVDRLTRLLDALRDDHALDLVYDDVEIALGGVTPTPEQIAEFTPRLRRALPQLVTVARKRAANRPHAVTDAEIAAIKAANQVLADTTQAENPAESRARSLLRRPTTPTDLPAALGYFRALGRITQDLLDILLDGDAA
ncbi:DUF6415 family natural product biosynthesis protein [Streptomyces hundungensis]|uniref:DUF6415 family natural product biosynthesis protein n=1 Tax=Streptomyces hundungensis TaxID=1077946 RepID=UPI0033EE3BB4